MLEEKKKKLFENDDIDKLSLDSDNDDYNNYST